MDIKVLDENRSPIEVSISLSVKEAATLSRGAWLRMARILKVEPEAVREKATSMFTRREIAQALAGIAMANAAQQAFDRLGVTFMMTPKFTVPDEFAEGEALEFTAKAYPVPEMELDLEKPIAVLEGEAPEDAIRRALRTRLHGSMPQSLIEAADAQAHATFNKKLAEQGITYREYRIQNNVKPSEVDERLARESKHQLEEDIALDLTYIRCGLEYTEHDEFDALASLAPGSEAELKREFLETGRICLLRQESRRRAAVRWAVNNLVQ